ncbi:hypothetical protein E2C01_071651 [Portunus trituberculatus]|uniref:Uncharacterized protein n=1 Tax=Portunus trituberculatus TaxID=210409 RepID=A0A5B7I4G9_PORTR|nr:hypothetical protein [Portunus trituberculatus]
MKEEKKEINKDDDQNEGKKGVTSKTHAPQPATLHISEPFNLISEYYRITTADPKLTNTPTRH